MGLAKRIGKSERLRGLLCWLVAAYVRLVFATSRVRLVRRHIPDGFWDQGRPFILALWHGRLLLLSNSWRAGVPVRMLISQHRDGQLIARTLSHFQIQPVTGSTTRGGSSALRAMLKMLKAGTSIGITPDGPKGPRLRAQPGVAALAMLSGCPVVPVSVSARPALRLGSWDRFLIPLPFSRVVMAWGEPIAVPAGLDEAGLAAALAEIEARMIALCQDTDRLAGIPPEEPPP